MAEDLRQRYAEALRTAADYAIVGEASATSKMLDAVMAVRDEELERLRLIAKVNYGLYRSAHEEAEIAAATIARVRRLRDVYEQNARTIEGVAGRNFFELFVEELDAVLDPPSGLPTEKETGRHAGHWRSPGRHRLGCTRLQRELRRECVARIRNGNGPGGSPVSQFHARICKIEGCPETIRAKGFCPFHYQRHLSGVAMDARRVISRDGPCLVDGCERPRRSRGLCGPHYNRGITRTECPACGGTMKRTSGVCDPCRRAAIAAQLPTEKTCRQCERTLSMDAFGLRKAAEGAAKWRSRCRECEAADIRLRPKNAHRDRSKERLSTPYLGLRAYAKKLGIPWVEVVERYPADNRCEVCRRTPEEANPGGRYVRLSLDHCHETGALRGFLCGPCNSGIGYLGDAPERLKTALAYLLKESPQHPPEAPSLSPHRALGLGPDCASKLGLTPRRPLRITGVPAGWDCAGQTDLLE